MATLQTPDPVVTHVPEWMPKTDEEAAAFIRNHCSDAIEMAALWGLYVSSRNFGTGVPEAFAYAANLSRSAKMREKGERL